MFFKIIFKMNKKVHTLLNTSLKNLLNSIDFSVFEHKLINLKH